MTAQLPHDPYRPQHTGPHTDQHNGYRAPYTGTYDQHSPPYAPQHGLRAPYPAPYVTSTPHVIRGDRNGMGTAGLVMGIVSLCFAVIPLVGIVAWFMWPLGVIFSGVGLNRANRALATNRNSALAGMIVSLTAAVVCFGWVLFTVLAGASGSTTHH